MKRTHPAHRPGQPDRRLLVASLFLAASLRAAAGPAPLVGLGLDESLAGEAVLAEALNQAHLRAQGLPVFARIVAAPADFGTPGAWTFEALDARLERYALKDVTVVLALTGALPAPQASADWRALLRALAERYRGRIRAYELGETTTASSAPDPTGYAFVLKQGAVQLRATDPGAAVIQGSLSTEHLDWQQRVYGEDLAAYVDALAVSGGASSLALALPAFASLLEREDSSASMLASLSEPAPATQDIVAWLLARLGSRVWFTSCSMDVAKASQTLKALERIKDLLAPDLVTLEDGNAGLRLLSGGRDLTTSLPHRLLYNTSTLGMFLVLDGASETLDLQVEIQDATARQPSLRDPLAAASRPLGRTEWSRAEQTTRARVALGARPMVLDYSLGADATVARSEVASDALPPVAEIVSRHQQAQAAQDPLLENYIANARMESHFRPSATDPGFDVITENRFYSGREGNEWEETSFTLNGSRWGAKRPPFPLLQAEKVLSLPLDLRLDKDYRYRLVGKDRVGARECYELRFEPLGVHSLYAGTVWIDTETFLKLKVQTVQNRLVPPVMSNEEIQYYEPRAGADGRALTLLSHFTTRQLVLIAGRNILVERIVRFSDFELNARDFTERRAASRVANNIMYRDTDKGLRYLVKRGDERVVEDRPTTSARALAFGVTVDPAYDYPLPLAGLNYLDFDFLDDKTQLSMLFGGVLALVNVQRPQVLGPKVDLSLDLFAIAVSSNDQVFSADGEIESLRLKAHPFSTGLNVGYQFNSFQKLIGSYQFRYDHYAPTETTASAFVTPASTVTNGLGLGYEFRRGGYSFVANGTHFDRGTWSSWGLAQEDFADQGSYDKWSVSLSKDFFIQSVHKIHLNAAYFGGRRLDRFSMYQFGFFDDNKIHGVPSVGVRFSELGMFRAGYSFNLFDLYRLDLFLDQALGKDPADSQFRSITGLGLGVNLRGPFGTLVRGEIGKSLLPERYSGAGTLVGQLLVLKPL